MNKIITYIKQTRNEMKHVSWPTRRQAMVLTIITIVLSLATAAYLGALDFVFTEAVKVVI